MCIKRKPSINDIIFQKLFRKSESFHVYVLLRIILIDRKGLGHVLPLQILSLIERDRHN